MVFDTAGTLTLGRGLGLLKSGGVFLDINPSPGKVIRGYPSGAYKLVFGAASPELLARVGAAAADGKLAITIGKTVPLDGAIALISDLEQGKRIAGKGVIVMA